MAYILKQAFLNDSSPRSIPLQSFPRRETGKAAEVLAGLDEPILGVAIRLSPSGHVNLLSIATPYQVYCVAIEPTDEGTPHLYKCFNGLLDGSHALLAGFDMAMTALHIFNDLQCHTQGVDLSTLFSASHKPWDPAEFVSKRLDSNINHHEIDRLWDDDEEKRPGEHVCFRAWLSAWAARSSLPQLYNTQTVDTRLLSSDELACLGQLVTQMVVLEKAKPNVVENEFSQVDTTSDGKLLLQNTRYSNHVRKSGKRTHVVLTAQDGQEFVGHATEALGKKTTIRADSAASSGAKFQHVRVVGREDLTSSERARNVFLLMVLRGERKLRTSLFIRYLWFPSDKLHWQPEAENLRHPDIQDMNESQRKVISAMVSRVTDLVITHGPPGTGKTSTIAAAVQIWDEHCSPVWIAAQSNVAVKNIAESLVKRGVKFKILVSKEFYVEWHEHIYEKIEESLIRSDELPNDLFALERVFLGSTVVLCTLGMLSNPQLENVGVFKLAPVERLVLDEASQIDVFEYMHLFDKFEDLKKVCFFGDPKQLPPYGQDTAPELQSVFNIKHLRNPHTKITQFLDTQYRMPVPLGNFISQEVYDKKLHSIHKISAMSSVAFIDVTKGRETPDKRSWKNMGEVQTIVHLVRNYYQHTDFCVVTPYDAQRAAIEKALEQEHLPWDRVFNVDSFQGNEAEYVLVSVTRTESPGFLRSQNRVNVMLTRCKLGMVIVTNREFLRSGNATRHTLLAKLARYWESSHGQMKTWIDWKLVAEHKVDLPGAPGAPSLCPTPPLPRPLIPTAGREPSVSDVKPVGRYVAPRHNRIDEEPLEDAFPGLSISGATKRTARSSWDNSSGLFAVKQASPCENWRGGRPPAAHSTLPPPFKDPFPPLTGGKGTAVNLGQWSHGPGRTISKW